MGKIEFLALDYPVSNERDSIIEYFVTDRELYPRTYRDLYWASSFNYFTFFDMA